MNSPSLPESVQDLAWKVARGDLISRADVHVRANDPHLVAGTRRAVKAHFEWYGVCLWFRANGNATLFYRDATGQERSKTWHKLRPVFA